MTPSALRRRPRIVRGLAPPLSLGATASLLVAINCEIMLSKLLYKPAQTEWGWAATPVATSSEQQERGTPW